LKKLLPCPFCGTVPTGRSIASTEHGPSIVCDGCGADGPPALGKKEQDGWDEKPLIPKAREAWNRRHPTAPPKTVAVWCALCPWEGRRHKTEMERPQIRRARCPKCRRTSVYHKPSWGIRS
jgi:hypothetical protein